MKPRCHNRPAYSPGRWHATGRTIRALLAERDALARDAARYQWLCARWGRISETYEGDLLILIEDDAEGWDTNPESIDAAIDAAIAAANGGTQ